MKKRGRRGFEFLRSLTEVMIALKPEDRPTMQEALAMFTNIVEKQSTWKLRSRAIRIQPNRRWDYIERAEAELAHWKRRVVYMSRRLPPIPKAPISDLSTTQPALKDPHPAD